jgi:DNA-binding NtrC family response regulator
MSVEPPNSILDTHLRQGVRRGSESNRPRVALVGLFPDERARYRLDGLPLLVGRSPEAGVQLDHPSVSRLHARIESQGTQLLLVDLLSKNGCAVNRKPVPKGGPANLSSGDVVRVGDVVLRLVASPEPRPSFSTATPSLVGGASLDEVRRLILLLAPTDLRVLVVGKSGTGKELVARELHAHSSCAGPLVAINCAALPETLVETELFGHVRGAFTGAVRDKPGLFETASGGTLFLDEVTELPLSTQAKLLRAVESGEVRRVGGLKAYPARCRIIAATNRELSRELERGRFREDLAARLFEAEIRLPTLAERAEDLPLLIRHLSQRSGISLAFDADALEALACYGWPLNVRELDNLLRTLSVVVGSAVGVDDLPAQTLAEVTPEREGPPPGGRDPRSSPPAAEVVEALRRNGGNIRRTGQELGVSRTFIYGVLRREGLSAREIRASRSLP